MENLTSSPARSLNRPSAPDCSATRSLPTIPTDRGKLSCSLSGGAGCTVLRAGGEPLFGEWPPFPPSHEDVASCQTPTATPIRMTIARAIHSRRELRAVGRGIASEVALPGSQREGGVTDFVLASRDF